MDLSNLGLVEHWLKLHIKLKASSLISSTGVLLGPHHGIADDAVSAGLANRVDIADSAVIWDIAYFARASRHLGVSTRSSPRIRKIEKDCVDFYELKSRLS